MKARFTNASVHRNVRIVAGIVYHAHDRGMTRTAWRLNFLLENSTFAEFNIA